MALKKLLASAAIGVLSAGALHFAISAAAASWAASYSPRVFNVTKFPADWSGLSAAYIRANEPSDKVLVIGSSFAFGYPFSSGNAWPSHLRMPTINASVNATELTGIDQLVLCPMVASGMKAGRMVLEIPLINSLSYVKVSPQVRACGSTKPGSLFAYALKHPVTVQWMGLLRDEYAANRTAEPLKPVPVADGYFLTAAEFGHLRNAFRAKVVHSYELAKQASNNPPLLYVTPVYIPGVKDGGQDAEAVRQQFAFAESVCIEIAGENCVRTDDLLERRDLYYNLTHLNPVGAEMLAKRFDERLTR